MPWSLISTRNETVQIARGGWLDALRFIVAFLIILHHFQAAGPEPLAHLINPIFERGGFLLTNFFLIDSGYVLMRVYGAAVDKGRMSPGDFFLKRFLRVVPAHLIMGLSLVAFVLLATAAGSPPRNPEWFAWDQLPAQLLLLQSYGVHGGLGWNAPTWSISALIGCYLAFPWIIRGLMRLGPWSALAVGVGVYLVANQLCWSFLGYPVYQMPMRYGIIRALPLFFLGMCLAWFAQKVWIAPRLAGWAGVLAAVGFFALQLHDKHALVALTLISIIIPAAGAVPVTKPRSGSRPPPWSPSPCSSPTRWSASSGSAWSMQSRRASPCPSSFNGACGAWASSRRSPSPSPSTSRSTIRSRPASAPG